MIIKNLLITEKTDIKIHTKYLYDAIKKQSLICQNLAGDKKLVTLFQEYYNNKLFFIFQEIHIKKLKKLNKLYFNSYNEDTFYLKDLNSKVLKIVNINT